MMVEEFAWPRKVVDEQLVLQAEVGRQATEAARWHATAEELSSENAKLRKALDIAVSRGCGLDWQPIATAPKDKPIIGLTDQKLVTPAEWLEGTPMFPEGWWFDRIRRLVLTHWIPLPPDPSN